MKRWLSFNCMLTKIYEQYKWFCKNESSHSGIDKDSGLV